MQDLMLNVINSNKAKVDIVKAKIPPSYLPSFQIPFPNSEDHWELTI